MTFNKGERWVMVPRGKFCDDCGSHKSHFCKNDRPAPAEEPSEVASEIEVVPEQVEEATSTSEVDTPTDESYNNLKDEEKPPVKPLTAKRPATKPWEPSENPWKRDYMRLKTKRPGWRVRFVSKRNIERNLDDGWAIADRANYGGVYDKVVGEEVALSTQVRRRELVLMEIPEERAKLRDKFFAEKSRRSTEARKKSFANRIKQDAGMATYVPAGYN